MENKPFAMLRGADVKAEYIESPLGNYYGNPLIEALQPLVDLEDTIARLSNVINFKREQRELNETMRAHLIFQLTRFVEPLETHLKIEQSLSIVIRDGYVDRNPLTANGVRILREGATNVAADMNSQNVQLTYSYKTSGSGLTVVGVSGMGKTTAINNILLKMFPAQVIRHGTYKGHNLNFPQIVWLKLETPHNGSVKGFCLSFFQSIDQLLGTNYYMTLKKARASAVELIPEMAQLCATYRIGVLVIDEIQHLLQANIGGQDEMLNFFVALKNAIGIPIVILGTTKAWNLLTREFRQAKRATEYFGMVQWQRMEKGERNETDEMNDWGVLLKALWNYQWVKDASPLDSDMFDAMYEYSQGITDVAIKLFMVAQWRAIATGVEKITPELISDVAKTELKALYPVIQAFRLQQIDKLEEAMDVFQKDFVIESHLNDVLAQIVKRWKTKDQPVTSAEDSDPAEFILKASQWLSEMGISIGDAESFVKKVIEIHGNVTLPVLKRLSYDLYKTTKETVEKKARRQPSTARRKGTEKNKEIDPSLDLAADIKKVGEI